MNIFSVLTLIFVALKLMGYITWSWWLVLTPMFIGVIFYIGVVVTYGYLIQEGLVKGKIK